MNLRPLFVPLLIVAGCAADEGTDVPADALDGYWNVDTHLVAGGCEDFGSVAPIEPGMLEIRTGEGVEMGRPGGDARTFEDRGVVLTWSGASRVDRCDVSADSVWETVEQSPTGFVAEVHVDVRAEGRRCDVAAFCSATYRIVGRR